LPKEREELCDKIICPQEMITQGEFLMYEGPMEMRAINFWGHIKNWYEVHSLEDNRRLMEEMALWGFNDITLIFERGGFRNYLNVEASDENSNEFWWKTKELAKAAHELGMKVSMIDSVNTVFIDQYSDPEIGKFRAEEWRPGFEGKHMPAISPYVLCPSKPKAREIMMKNQETSYKEFPVVDTLFAWPYDVGGCGCDECHPWPKTFVGLAREMADKLHKYHPKASVYLSLWDMTDKEVSMVVNYLREDKPDWVQGILEKEWKLISIENEGLTERWRKANLPEKYRKGAFIDLCQIGGWGWHVFTANPYPARFEKMFTEMRKEGIVDFSCYSEDLHDDINKYLAAKLSVSPKKGAKDLIKDYCYKYFGAAVGDDIYEVCCWMEDERTNKFASPWMQGPVWDKDAANKTLSILKDVEKRIPRYCIESFRWQVLVKRAEISVLLNEIGNLDEFKANIKSLVQEALAKPSTKEAKDQIRNIGTRVSEKQKLLTCLNETIRSFKVDTLEEPEDRTITVLSAFPQYYTWMKTLIQMEEPVTSAMSTNTFDRVINIMKQCLSTLEESTPPKQ